MQTSNVRSTITPIQAVIKDLRSQDKLPFQDVLSSESLNDHLSTIGRRDRIFTPELTLFYLLSQAIGPDPSCQSSVSQVIAHLISQGVESPSPNTAAYCKARSRFQNMSFQD